MREREETHLKEKDELENIHKKETSSLKFLLAEKSKRASQNINLDKSLLSRSTSSFRESNEMGDESKMRRKIEIFEVRLEEKNSPNGGRCPKKP